ncbi:hypothetical protein [Methylobacterium oryzisoli]|uniref:hypothetical protein n=1 Tax=Methylobacterium oryzisoli TaxID=3385502 RepID=UPI0038915CE8
MRSVAAVLIGLITTGALAEGFAVRDLRTVTGEATAALGGRFASRAEAGRLTLACPDCEGGPMIDVLIGRQTDGTEGRVRSGQTSLAQLEALCQARSPDCRLSGLSVAPAVGWITTYPMGRTAGATAVILRDGDSLTIRSLASDGAVARRNAETLARTVAPRIVGR